MANWKEISISVVACAMVILGMVSFMTDLFTQYEVDADTSFNTTFAKSQQLLGYAKNTSEKAQQGKLAEGGSEADILQSVRSAIVFPFKAVGLLFTMFSELMTTFGLPLWFVNGFVAIILFTVAFLILSFLWRYHGR